MSARAFTFGTHIFLGKGERADDLTLIAHEAAHIVQQQHATGYQMWSTARDDAFEHEADRASSSVQRGEAFQVRERLSTPRVQRWPSLPGIGSVRNYMADAAYNIGGFRMFTILIGKNPINDQQVDRSPANIMRAAMEIVPLGHQLVEALDKYGVFDTVGGWVNQQLTTAKSIASSVVSAFLQFVNGIGLSDIAHPGDTWDRAVAIFTGPLNQILDFIKGLAEGIWHFIRDAILKPLASLAEGTPAWDLLLAVLGKNPITGEKVASDPSAVVGGFMKLIGQEELWANIKKANALSRIWAWFQTNLNQLVSFVSQIPTLFVSALTSLEIADVLILPRGFMKLARVFGNFAIRFGTWALDATWSLLQIIFEVVAPGAMPYLKKLGASFRSILKNPMGFVSNLVAAAKLGFMQFANNIGAHLKSAFIGWLTGSLTGVYIPASFDFREIIKFVLSVLGLSWANIRSKLVKVLGEPAVKVLETTFDIVVVLVREGPAAAWDKIKEYAGNLKDMAINAIMDYIVGEVVKKAIAKIVGMFVPGGAFISAIISIYDTIVVFISKLSKMMQVATAFLDSMMQIASGAIGAAANKVETTLEGLLSLAISFLAGFLGLGKVADKVMNIINTKIRTPIDKAIDKVIDWVVKGAGKVLDKITGKDKKKAADAKDSKNEKMSADPEVQKRWVAGMAAVQAVAAKAHANPLTDDQVKQNLAPIQTQFGFKELSATRDGKTWRVHAVMNPDDTVTIDAKPERPAAIKDKATPVLDKLELQEPGASVRYVSEYGSYTGSYYKDIVRYVESRAARKLGRIAEVPGLAAYLAKGGAIGTRNNAIIEILKKNKESWTVDRLRIPDIFAKSSVVGDVKNVADQSFDEQMRDNVRIANSTNVRMHNEQDRLTGSCRFDLVVRAPKEGGAEGTHVSQPLKDAVAANRGTIYEIL